MSGKYVSASERRIQIISAGFEHARKCGIDTVTADVVALKTGMSKANVLRLLSTERIRSAIIRRAVQKAIEGNNDKEVLSIIASGLCNGNVAATNAPVEVRRAAADSLV